MHKQRIERLQAMLVADCLDGILYADSGDMQYFLDDPSCFFYRMRHTGNGRTAEDRIYNGHFAHNPDRILLIPAVGEPVLITTYQRAGELKKSEVPVVATHFAVLHTALGKYIKGKQRIAVGQSCDKALRQMVGEIDRNVATPNGEKYSEALRVIKDAGEIEKMRAVCAFTDQSMGRVAKALVPGATALDIRELIGTIALENDLDLSFDPGVMYVHTGGPASDIMFSCPEDSPIREGTAISFDYGFVMDGYCSDYGRSFYCGTHAEIRKAYALLQEAQLDLLGKIKPGVGLNTCYKTVYSYLKPSGLSPYLRQHDAVHTMGHQIGVEQHERPRLRDDETEVLFQPGMVVCVEPKIWWPGKCYLRCEDIVLVTETGCESLTTYDRNHFEL